MLRNLAWQATDEMTRAQLAMFHALGDEISLTQDDRRRALSLDERAWAAWEDFMMDGPLPAAPTLSDMLQRVAQTAFCLSVVAKRLDADPR
jgi:hypothetical protein